MADKVSAAGSQRETHEHAQERLEPAPTLRTLQRVVGSRNGPAARPGPDRRDGQDEFLGQPCFGPHRGLSEVVEIGLTDRLSAVQDSHTAGRDRLRLTIPPVL